MTDRISFRVFLMCLLSCAALALGVIWFEHQVEVPLYFQTTATLFITGLASFLIWFTSILKDIRELLRRPDSN